MRDCAFTVTVNVCMGGSEALECGVVGSWSTEGRAENPFCGQLAQSMINPKQRVLDTTLVVVLVS